MSNIRRHMLLAASVAGSTPAFLPTRNVINFFDAPEGNPHGLTFDGTNLISCDTNSDLIYIHNGVSDEILSSFSTPASSCYDLAFDGTNLISSDINTDTIYVHDGISANILYSFPSPGSFPFGLTFDGTNLISCDSSADLIYIHSGVSGTITSTFSAPATAPGALAFDGTNLISCDYGSDKIYVHDGISSTILKEVDTFGTNHQGLTFANGHVVASDTSGDSITVYGNEAPDTAARYWRVMFKDYQGGVFDLRGIEFRMTAGGADQTSPALAQARTIDSGATQVQNRFPYYAFDDTFTTYAVRLYDEPEIWIGWDFGSPITITEARVYQTNGVQALRVQSSQDGTTWKDEIAAFGGDTNSDRLVTKLY